MNYCECGCNQKVAPGKRFIRGHQSRIKHKIEEKEIKNILPDLPVMSKKKFFIIGLLCLIFIILSSGGLTYILVRYVL